MKLELIGKPGCSLCDEMRAVISPICLQRGIDLVEVSLVDHPELEDKYWEEIPVLVLNDKKIAFWRISEEQFAAALDAANTVGH